MKYTTFAYEIMCIPKLCVTFNTYAIKHCSLCYTYKSNCSSTTKMKIIASQEERWPIINTLHTTETIECFTCTWKVNTKCGSLLVIGSVCSTGDQVIRNFRDACCHLQEILASQSSVGYCYMSIKIFNKLPDHITDSIRNKRSFISRLNQYLVNKSLYSLDEFMNN
jgi:hypothetical protein